MADTPTTEETVQVEGAQEALPTDEQQPVAEETVTESTEQAGAEEALPEESDDKLAKFAKAQGIEDISELNEREQRLLKVAHDNHVNYRQKQNKDSELQKTLGSEADKQAEVEAMQTGYDVELLKTVRGLEVRQEIDNFFNENPDARDIEPEMAQVIAERPHLARDLDAVYAIASRDQVATKAKKETLENLAQNQQAAAPKGNATTQATTSEKITPSNVEALVAKNGHDWFVKHYDEINAALTK